MELHARNKCSRLTGYISSPIFVVINPSVSLTVCMTHAGIASERLHVSPVFFTMGS